MSRTAYLDNFLDLLDLVRKKPRTVSELVELTGSTDQTVRKWLSKLEQSGFVCRRHDKAPSGNPQYVFHWSTDAA